LFRVAFYIRTLHPDIFGRNFIWKPDEPLQIGAADYSIQDTPQFAASPISIVAREGREIRARVGDPDSARWPIVEDLRAEGHTESMNAAIWLSDLRGFTALSDRLPPETVVDILNNYFDCQVAAIKAHGGEVLKYMGDGLLAVFPIDEYVGDSQQVCAHVLEAARETRTGVEAMQYPVGNTIERFRFGVALHVGPILYGNIGGGSRLDFTCIGPAVNLAARLEKLTGKLR